MKPDLSDQTRCVFRVRCEAAQQVKLVIERRFGPSQIFSLQPCGEGMWETVLHLEPGKYRYCYHTYTGRTLTYLTPPNAPLDGLKAVLNVEPLPVAEVDADADAQRREAARRVVQPAEALGGSQQRFVLNS